MENLRKLLTKKKDKYPIETIFSLGLYHKFNNVQRIYLDKLFGKKYDESIDYVTNLVKINMGKQFYVCLVDYSDFEMSFFDKHSIANLNKIQIQIPNYNIYMTKYIKDDEWYEQYLMFIDYNINIKKYISGIINRVRFNKPSINTNVFFVDLNLKMVINLYDDRGLDILKLE